MPAGYPEWPGPRDAEEGKGYSRQEPEADGNVFVAESISERDDGAVVVSGHYEVVQS